jgi:acetolactate synthase I/II/III large subunit
MKGSQYIAKFLKAVGANKVFQVQGGAISFMVDAIALEEGMEVICFQHEQAAAMAADAVWRTNGQLGVSMATSGPGASNLVTGIACGYYDSIPSLHIAGQVNYEEQKLYRGAAVRQAGFQQMDIVSMVKPICKYAVAVTTHDEMRQELKRCVEQAYEGRMGPVLIDIPMNLQNAEMDNSELLLPDPSAQQAITIDNPDKVAHLVNQFFAGAQRPLVIFGAGVGLAGTNRVLESWLRANRVPFVSTWASLNYFNHTSDEYIGHFGVYGNRGGNFAVQNADRILVLGSRLDNRQRSGNPANFAPNAKILCLDIDRAELEKLDPARYTGVLFDFRNLEKLLNHVTKPTVSTDWVNYLRLLKSRYFNKDTSAFSKNYNTMSPYAVVEKLQQISADDAVITTDAGANHCWVYQTFYKDRDQLLMTSSGHYAMGYALPASIGAALVEPNRQHICCNGDGGIQMNLQELQTAKEYNLDIKVVIFNNRRLGMICQFQDAYMGGRHAATDKGPGRPDFEKIANAFDFDYVAIHSLDQIVPDILKPGRRIIEIKIHPGTQIEPKLEMGRPINDQSPLVSDQEFAESNPYYSYTRK